MQSLFFIKVILQDKFLSLNSITKEATYHIPIIYW